MSERHGYGYGEQPSGERPSGRGAVAERRAGQEEVREVDLTDEAAQREREVPASARETSGTFEPHPAGARPTSASTSIFDVGGDQQATTPAPAATAEPAAPEAEAAPGAEATTAEPAAEPAAAPAGPPTALLASLDGERVRSRFLDIQARFVDEPRQAVEEAGRLVEDLVQQVIDALQAQRGQLHAPADESSTEELRLALRSYRQFVDRLLALGQ
jgi:hypothetical protein